MIQVRRVLDAFPSFIPQWLAKRPAMQTGYRVLYVTALCCDIAIQACIEGVRAGFPMFDGRTDALPLIGASRGLVQGETETNANFAARCINWLVIAQDRGGDVGLARAIHLWLGNNPMVRVISRSGRYTTVAADGTVSQVNATWNWDSVSNPSRAGIWKDYWIVVYPPEFAINQQSPLPWDVASQDLGWGHQCTRIQVDTIRGLVETWRGGHVNVRSIVWSYNSALFDPANPGASGNPDGTWGRWFNPATNTATRNNTCRYWTTGVDTES